MNVRPIQPLTTAREFKCNEMFFSVTDEMGVILSGNDVFVRVSGFTREELEGRPHNLIRHPDMPRAVFALFWDNLKKGAPFAGYVKNMAKDGGYYWVYAVAVPASGGRYLSIRFKPTLPLLGQVEALYGEMLAAENAELAGRAKEKDAVAAGKQVLVSALKRMDFGNYDTFSHAALNQEMKARDACIQAEGTVLFRTKLDAGKARQGLGAIYDCGVLTYTRIDGLFKSLDGIVQFNRGLQERAAAVLTTSEDFRLHALNVDITAQHHGTTGAGVSVVADFLGNYSGDLMQATVQLRENTAAIARETESINACVAMARLQMEMLLYFQAELATQEAEGGGTDELKTLEEGFVASTTQVLESLARLRENLPRLQNSHKALFRSTISIEMAQVSGLTETARIPEAETLGAMFAEFRKKIGATRTHLDDLSTVIDRIAEITRNTPAQIEDINRATAKMHADINALTVV